MTSSSRHLRLEQGRVPHVVAVKHQQVERHEERRTTSEQQRVEVRSAVGIETCDLAVQNGGTTTHRRRDLPLQGFPLTEGVAVAADEPALAVLDERERAEAIPLHLVNPVEIVKRRSGAHEPHGGQQDHRLTLSHHRMTTTARQIGKDFMARAPWIHPKLVLYDHPADYWRRGVTVTGPDTHTHYTADGTPYLGVRVTAVRAAELDLDTLEGNTRRSHTVARSMSPSAIVGDPLCARMTTNYEIAELLPTRFASSGDAANPGTVGVIPDSIRYV
jgi:hypothetical protein